jgi:hypothetical protein
MTKRIIGLLLMMAMSAAGLSQLSASFENVPALEAVLLSSVRDDTPFGNWQQAMPWEIPAEAKDEHTAYWQAVINAARTTPTVFAQAAEQNRQLTFGHCYSEPSKYRGQVLHLEGRLARLKQLDPPNSAKKDGVAVLYEAWIYLDQPGTHPVCVILPQKPDGIEPGENLNRRITVDGYFFKRYRYLSGRLDAAGNNIALNTILLIAPTLLPKERPVATASAGLGQAWLWLGCIAGAGVVLILAMTWWFRHNDRQIQTHVQSICRPAFAGATFDQPLPNPNTCRM